MLRLPQPRLSEQLALKIRELILNKQLKPGDRLLSESTLIDMYGVGRSTIREAIKLLIAENVVTVLHGRGTFICERTGINSDPLGLKYSDQTRLLINLFETRLILEPQIASLAARRATKDDINKLEQIMKSFNDSEANSWADFPSLDVDFHTTLANCSKNDVLFRFVPSVCDAIWKGQRETQNNPNSHEKAIIYHQKVFEAIRDRHPKKAATEMSAHINQTACDMHIILAGGRL